MWTCAINTGLPLEGVVADRPAVRRAVPGRAADVKAIGESRHFHLSSSGQSLASANAYPPTPLLVGEVAAVAFGGQMQGSHLHAHT